MKSYTERDMERAIEACGLQEGATLLVHSSLIHLGRPVGFDDLLHEVLFRLIKDRIGENGTIVVPTFNFGFCRGEPFVPDLTISIGMGDFSEYVRQLPGAVRSPHPMQSVAAIGRYAHEICEKETRSSFDPGGAFDVMLKLEAHGFLFGAPMQSFSFVHLAEERLSVPYRYWKEFTGPYGNHGQERTFSMYVRDLNINPILKLSKIERKLEELSLTRTAKLGGGRLQLFSARHFVDVTLSELSTNPTWLID